MPSRTPGKRSDCIGTRDGRMHSGTQFPCVSTRQENDPKKAQRIFRRFLEQGSEAGIGLFDPSVEDLSPGRSCVQQEQWTRQQRCPSWPCRQKPELNNAYTDTCRNISASHLLKNRNPAQRPVAGFWKTHWRFGHPAGQLPTTTSRTIGGASRPVR